MSLHLHNSCVLPLVDQAVYHVPADAACTGRPPTASFGRTVSLEELNKLTSNLIFIASKSCVYDKNKESCTQKH